MKEELRSDIKHLFFSDYCRIVLLEDQIKYIEKILSDTFEV